MDLSDARKIALEAISRIAAHFDVEIKEDKTIDLTSLPNEGVLEFFERLRNSVPVVLHGANSDAPYAVLEPRQANDAAKESGNKEAVYATLDVFAALNHAIFNRKYLESKEYSFSYGEHNEIDDKTGETKPKFKVSPNIYRFFKNHDPEVVSDGFVYLLDRTSFLNAPDAGIEYHSEEKQVPIAVCKVSKKLAELLFVAGRSKAKDTVVEYTPEELAEINTRMVKLRENAGGDKR